MKNFWILLTISLGLIFLDSNHILNPIKSVTERITMPIQYSLYATKHGLEDSISFLTFWKSGEARIKNLEQRNLELLSYEQKAKSLEKENALLRKQMGVAQLLDRKLFPAIVLFSGDHLLISAGSEDGIKVGQSTVIFDNYLGKISKTNPRTSVVQLPSDIDAKTPVKVGLARGLVTGQFNSSMSLEKITQNEEIKADDMVLTSGDSGIEPNLIVGKVKKVEKVETELFQKITMTPVVNYSELSTVFVILD